MMWKYCKVHCIKFKGDICPECSNNKNGVEIGIRRGGDFKRVLEDGNEKYIKKELGI